MVARSSTAADGPPRLLLVRAMDPGERAAIEAGAQGRASAYVCSSAQRVVAMLREHEVAGVVLEVGAGGGRELLPIVAALEGRTTLLLLRFSLSGAVLRDVVAQHARINDLRVSVWGYDALAADVARLLAPSPMERPRLAIVGRVLRLPSGPAVRIIGAAALAGERATAVHTLAVLCDVSVRTLETRCYEAGILAPKSLLGWMLALHTTWRITRWGWSAPQAAGAAGLPTVDALSDRMQRATGSRLVAACREVGFDELLERFAAALVEGSRRRYEGGGGKL